MLPDVISDPIIVAAKKMGLDHLQAFFYQACIENGYRDSQGHREAENKAMEFYNIYMRHLHGFMDMPRWIRDFARQKAEMPPVQFSDQPIGERKKVI